MGENIEKQARPKFVKLLGQANDDYMPLYKYWEAMEAGESLKRCIQVISNIILTSLGGYGGSGLSDLGLKLRTWVMMLEVRLKKIW